MSRGVQLVLVCEDSQQEAFVRRFLKLAGWNMRSIRVEKAPPGVGAAEQFVRDRYPIELEAFRANRHRVTRGLIVITDGDRFGRIERKRMLEESCERRGISPRQADEPVVLCIPTWNIESWIAYLHGEDVDESRGDYPRLERARDCHPMVEPLFEMCQQQALRLPAPESLLDACQEYHRLDHC
ncbi:hypothetical protein [Tuwongella immobilis]|uniref:Uncharacterized protein n=1 Tax=Tuwongella immobilis TaxID=692036 RepID=A0A6C2YX21_9BACT|nr:hypothetical protein [Tuwongella immobilis]VIP05365.1 Uncharacterized protein OS=Desulfonatronospira thiodismutans ASO3-1 GN=Dthio_PD0148 PE=4 SV=1 [Tuwongella immobilis]VTS08086.1 Uncharacterized protein OS=Desulfonatronospira thiodismutans ASO3-1 GN=Dthio_PD0148 PE=4 SV=1 [Tuwongella immobilis]